MVNRNVETQIKFNISQAESSLQRLQASGKSYQSVVDNLQLRIKRLDNNHAEMRLTQQSLNRTTAEGSREYNRLSRSIQRNRANVVQLRGELINEQAALKGVTTSQQRATQELNRNIQALRQAENAERRRQQELERTQRALERSRQQEQRLAQQRREQARQEQYQRQQQVNQVGGLVGLGVTGSLFSANRAGIELERQRARLYAVDPSLTPENRAFLARQAQLTAAELPFNVRDIYEAYGTAQLFGIGVGQGGSQRIADVGRLGGRLATLGQTDINTGVYLASSLRTVFREFNIDQLGNALATARAQGNIDIESLAATIGFSGPAAAAIGINPDELFGLLATVTRAGVPAPQASQNVGQLLNALAKGDSELSLAIQEQTGLTVRENIAQGRSISELLQELRSTRTPEQFSEIFGRIQAARVGQIITGEGFALTQEILDKVNNSLNDTSSSSGDLARSLSELENTQFYNLGREISRSTTSFQVAGDRLNQTFIPAIAATLRPLNALAEAALRATESGLGRFVFDNLGAATYGAAGAATLVGGAGILGRFTGSPLAQGVGRFGLRRAAGFGVLAGLVAGGGAQAYNFLTGDEDNETAQRRAQQARSNEPFANERQFQTIVPTSKGSVLAPVTQEISTPVEVNVRIDTINGATPEEANQIAEQIGEETGYRVKVALGDRTS